METDTQSLVQSAIGGDTLAVETLLERHLPRLRAYVRLRTGALIEAKESVSDLVQSVCREVLEELPSFEYRDEASFRAWLFQHAAHKIADRGRFYHAAKRDAEREVDAATQSAIDDAVPGLLTPSRDAIGKEELHRLEDALQALPEEQRTAILLQRVVGLPYSEIAAQLGKSEGATRNLVYRGLAKVALNLERG